VENFRIRFAKEKIAKSGLFVAKKKYAIRTLWNEGEYVDKISVTGLETVRGDSSEAVRDKLKHIMEMIIKGYSDEDITRQINQYKMELLGESPEGLAANIGVKNINKWIKSGKAIKGTPWHVKGVANYRKLLSVLSIEDKYEDITEGMKVKVVYVKPNQWSMETISFYRWPEEFDRFVEIDYDKMIDNFFLKKIEFLLEPMGKKHLLKNDINIKPIIVENNGLRKTFLDDLNCDICYTNNNFIDYKHKGENELLDIKEVINQYNIKDDNTIIKITGRY